LRRQLALETNVTEPINLLYELANLCRRDPDRQGLAAQCYAESSSASPYKNTTAKEKNPLPLPRAFVRLNGTLSSLPCSAGAARSALAESRGATKKRSS